MTVSAALINCIKDFCSEAEVIVEAQLRAPLKACYYRQAVANLCIGLSVLSVLPQGCCSLYPVRFYLKWLTSDQAEKRHNYLKMFSNRNTKTLFFSSFSACQNVHGYCQNVNRIISQMIMLRWCFTQTIWRHFLCSKPLC